MQQLKTNKHIVSNEKKIQIDYSEQETLMPSKQGRVKKKIIY